MKKTQLIDVLTDLKKNIIPIISIMVFVSLSVEIFFGLGWYVKSLNQSFDEYSDNGMASNIEYFFAFGADDDDLDKFKEIKGIDIAEGVYIAYGSVEINEHEYVVEIKNFDGELNKIDLIEGEYPSDNKEILVEKYAAADYDLNVGDVINISQEDASSTYFINKYKNDFSVFNNINSDTEDEHFCLKNSTYKISGIVDSTAQIAYSDHPYNYETMSKTQLTFFVNEDDFIKECFAGYSRICLYSKDLSDLDITSDEYSRKIDELLNKTDIIAEEINKKGFQTFKDAYNNFLSTQSFAAFAYGNLSNTQVTNNKFELTSAKSSNNSLNNIEETNYVTLYKANSIAAATIETIAGIMNKSKDSLVSVYLVIALLISYSVITRMVSDSCREIGTKKALGFRKKEIYLHYVCLMAIVLVIGFILGVLSNFIVQFSIIKVLNGTLQFPINSLYFSFKEMAFLFMAYLLVFALIVYLSCNAIVKKKATVLLADNNDKFNHKHFYENTKLYQKLSLISKATINNCFNERKRVLSTIVGITSCMVLLTASLTLGRNVSKSFDIQYDDYYRFDTQIKYDGSDESRNEISDILNNNNLSFLRIYYDDIYVKLGDKDYSGHLFVYPSDENISEFINIRSDGDIPFNSTGIWISEGVKQHAGYQTGDTIGIETYLGESFNGEINGFVDEHIASVDVYIDSDTYEKLSGDTYETNSFIFNKGNNSIESITKALKNVDDCNAIDFVAMEEEVNNLFIMLTGAIELVYFSASLVLAIFVILNLLTTLVEEKRKEVIIMMINGYSLKKVKKYIYTDTIYITIISIILGVIIGNFVGIAMVKQMEEIYIVFIHSYDWLADVVASLITISLVALMSFVALKRVDKFSLSELQK